MHGPELGTWQRQLGGAVLTTDEVNRGAAVIYQFVEKRDEHIRKTDGALPLLVELGPFGLLGRVTTGVLGGLFGFIALGALLEVVGERSLIPSLGVSLAIGVAARRIERIKLLAIGWVVMTVAFCAVLTALYALDWLT